MLNKCLLVYSVMDYFVIQFLRELRVTWSYKEELGHSGDDLPSRYIYILLNAEIKTFIFVAS